MGWHLSCVHSRRHVSILGGIKLAGVGLAMASVKAIGLVTIKPSSGGPIRVIVCAIQKLNREERADGLTG